MANGRLPDALEEHGELHCTVEGHDNELELRLGQTICDDENQNIEVWDGTTTHTIPYDRIVSFYKPMEIWH